MKTDVLISISDKALLKSEPVNNFALLKAAGFTHIHFSHLWQTDKIFSEEEIESLRAGLEAAGLRMADSHGPHPGGANLASEDPVAMEAAYATFRQRLALTADFGGDSMVYHVPTREFDDDILERYVEGLKRLEVEVRDKNMIIALENHYKPEIDKRTLSRCFEEFDFGYIGLTFDPGHAAISGNERWLLDNCFDRLKILHLNDNPGVGDKHWLPFDEEGVANWEAIIEGIAGSPYDKPIQLEVAWHVDRHETIEEFLRAAAENARDIHRRVESLRSQSHQPIARAFS